MRRIILWKKRLLKANSIISAPYYSIDFKDLLLTSSGCVNALLAYLKTKNP